ncbi:unnamed protein product [Mesocestoides corti]|uniref:Uncharacterized protein n=2 Tax=Mesocestoides corti TaxID=53468 RepID=A0A0R3U977_MESCO|nr:unnamed protein product [Mesocestoides corti]
MDDGYGSLARAIDFTLSNQIKRRSSTQNQEHRSATSSLSTPPPPSEELSSPGLCVRRSHSIGTVAGAMVSLPSPTKNGGFNLSQKPTVPAAIISSARNSFSIVAGEESSFQSSPAVSTAALSDIDFESTARPSTVSCFSSPATSRRLLGPATPLALATLHRHSQASRRSSLLDIPAKQLAEQITYLEAAKYGRLTVSLGFAL